jgi:Predicted membrane protein (DUF2079)
VRVSDPAVAERWAVILIVAFTALAVYLGLRTGYHTLDVDEVVFLRTLRAMQHGASYYTAMRHALVLKEEAPPTQLRSIRPPTTFLLLALFPAWSWRWLVGGVYLASLVCAWRLGRQRSPWGGPAAVVLVGLWLMGAAPLLFLHPELWGLPFALAGLLAARGRRWALAAACIGVAVLFRELYAVLFVVGFLFAPKRRPWAIVGAALVALAAIHAALASSILSAHGREAAFGSGSRGVTYVLTAISPSGSVLGWLIGAATTVGGIWAVASRSRGHDRGVERMVLLYVAVMIPLTLILGRDYWDLTYGPLLACFVPAAVWSRSTGLRDAGDERPPSNVAPCPSENRSTPRPPWPR